MTILLKAMKSFHISPAVYLQIMSLGLFAVGLYNLPRDVIHFISSLFHTQSDVKAELETKITKILVGKEKNTSKVSYS